MRQQQDFQATSPPGCSGTHAAVGLWVNGTSRKISPSAFCCSSGESSGARTSQSCNIQSRESWGWGWGWGVQRKLQIFLYISLVEKIHIDPYKFHISVAVLGRVYRLLLTSCRLNHLRWCYSSRFLLHVEVQLQPNCKQNLNGGASSCRRVGKHAESQL